jgi:hypothetical protein
MRLRTTLALAALVAALTLAVAVGGATAGRLRLNDVDLTLTWEAFEIPNGDIEEPEGGIWSCPLTLSGSFHATTFAKLTGLLVGTIANAQFDDAGCTEGTQATILGGTLPWHLTYQQFLGVLPQITEVRLALLGMSMAIHVPTLSVTCLLRTTSAEPLPLELARDTRGGVIVDVAVDSDEAIDASDTGGILCDLFEGGLEWQFGGHAEAEVGGGTSLTLTLI